MSRLDPRAFWRVSLVVMNRSPLSGPLLGRVALGTALVLGSGAACGGKDKGKKTTAGSTGSVSDGTAMDSNLDPANMDPEAGIPMADPNDRPPEREADSGGVADESVPEELRPPGLDIAPEERAKQVNAHLVTANAAIQNNTDPDRAISSAKAALQVDETSIDAMVLLAHGNVIKGYYDLAEDVLMKAFERGGKSNKKAFFLLGLVYEKTKRLEKAPIAYQNALTLDPNYKSALMNLGVSHLGTKRYKDAVRIYERLSSELGMDEASVWTNLGSSYRGHSLDFALTDITMRNTLVLKAEEAYKRAISRDKNYANAYYNMGLLYLDADPYPVGDGEMDRVVRLKNAKTYFDEYRRLPNADQKLVDTTSAVAQKLIDKEALLRKKQADRAAKIKALEEKKAKRAADKASGKDEFDDEGFE